MLCFFNSGNETRVLHYFIWIKKKQQQQKKICKFDIWKKGVPKNDLLHVFLI